MTTEPHFEATETPADLRTGITTAGKYLAQAGGIGTPLIAPGVLYAVAATAPTDIADYFHVRAGGTFEFYAGSGTVPVWVRTVPGDPNPVAVPRGRLADD